MRINKFVALSSGVSRRKADLFIKQGRVKINDIVAKLSNNVGETDVVKVDELIIKQPPTLSTIMINKPTGFVCSKDGQGSKTVYELLPKNLQNLKTVGRLDKDSSGLILLTNDGDLAQRLTHPSYQKEKIYEINLDKKLNQSDERMIEHGVKLNDGISKLKLRQLSDGKNWQITMHEGRNRQIRRTFEALGYHVIRLHRTNFGDYSLDNLAMREFKEM